jgi:small redox-active disulfide protein 2
MSGLPQILEEVRNSEISDVNELKEMLLQKVKKHNYVVDSAVEDYKIALYREYRRFLGEEVEEVEAELTIKILGPGCSSCERLENEVIQVLQELNLPIDVQHIRDINEIARYKIMATPGLVINGKLMSSGRVPTRSQLRDWFLKKDR